MSVQDALSRLLTERIPDKRVCFSDVSVQAGVLEGRATSDFETLLYGFAKEHKLALRVTFSEPGLQKVAAPRAFLRAQPQLTSEVVSEALYGETLAIFDRKEDFVLASREKDKYLGWISLAALSHHMPQASHWLRVPKAHVFSAAKVSASILFEISLGVTLHVLSVEDGWAEILLPQAQRGFVKATLLADLNARPKATAAAVTKLAARFIDSPYVWGGISAWGLDCSGFAQTVYGAFDIQLPRDADQQAQTGREVQDIKAADLLFFPGHVAIALSSTKMIHANAQHMRVTIDDKDKTAYAQELWDSMSSIKRFID